MKTLLSLTIVLLLRFNCYSQNSNEIHGEILKLLKLTKTEQNMTAAFTNVLAQMKASSPDVPVDVWAEMERAFDARALTMKIVPIFERYYSLEDLRGMISFYESPLGKKITATLPDVTAESMRVGQEFAQTQFANALASVQQKIQREQTNSGTSLVQPGIGTVRSSRGMSEQQKRDYLIQNGLDPDKYEVVEQPIDSGKPALSEEGPNYSIQVPSGRRFFSKAEPKRENGMFKFHDLRSGKDVQVSADGIVITKLR